MIVVGSYWNTPSNIPHTHNCFSSSKVSLPFEERNSLVYTPFRHVSSWLLACLVKPESQTSNSSISPWSTSSVGDREKLSMNCYKLPEEMTDGLKCLRYRSKSNTPSSSSGLSASPAQQNIFDASTL